MANKVCPFLTWARGVAEYGNIRIWRRRGIPRWIPRWQWLLSTHSAAPPLNSPSRLLPFSSRHDFTHTRPSLPLSVFILSFSSFSIIGVHCSHLHIYALVFPSSYSLHLAVSLIHPLLRFVGPFTFRLLPASHSWSLGFRLQVLCTIISVLDVVFLISYPAMESRFPSQSLSGYGWRKLRDHHATD